MNTWSGAVLWQLYDFTNASIKPALFSLNTSSTVSFTMNITATRNGVATPFTLVAADAEGSDHTESTTFSTNGNNWKTIEFFRNSNQANNPLTGCGTKTAILSQTYGGAPQTGQNPILATENNSGTLSVTTTMQRSVSGGMAVAFGIFSPIDRGDFPSSYKLASHGLSFTTNNSCNFNVPFPSVTQNSSLRLGAKAGDADGMQTLDDNNSGSDEDGVSLFPLYDGSITYTLSVQLSNTTGNDAFLNGWFDFNRDGGFSNSEKASVTIANNASTAVLKWTGLPSILPAGTVTDYGFRFRLSSTTLDVQSEDGYARDGEVEDYLIAQNTIKPSISVLTSFTAPDTVCVGTPVALKNTSVGATTYYWNFCAANNNKVPTGTNLGNINNAFKLPVFIDYINDGGNFYGFVINHTTRELIRLDFGSSLLNTPVINNLGTVGGVIPRSAEGIQIIKNENKWYAIIVGGNPASGELSQIAKIELGTNIANNTPLGTNWGNIGNLSYPIDLYVFEDNGQWYGLTVNSGNNTITRFNFSNSFSNTPIGFNLGNTGNLSIPTGVYAIKENNNWYASVTSEGSSLTRLDFGNSLLNIPSGINLGNINGSFNKARDISILKSCGSTKGYVVNGSTNDILELDFNQGITMIPTVKSIGNIGDLDFPHSISKLFRVGPDLFFFITNVNNNTLTRVQFSGCNNSSLPNSSAKGPGTITYDAPGTYNINLTVDEGLPTQSSFCKQVVVLPKPAHFPEKKIAICVGDSIKLGSSTKLASYIWNTSDTKDSIFLKAKGIYWVEANQYGCINRDSFVIEHNEKPLIHLREDTSICRGASVLLSTNPSGTYTFNWTPSSELSSSTTSNPIALPTNSGQYIVTATNSLNCIIKDTVTITVKDNPIVNLGSDKAFCPGDDLVLNAENQGANFLWQNGSISQNLTARNAGEYHVKVTKDGCSTSDTINLALKIKPVVQVLKDTAICKGESLVLETQAIDAVSYSWIL